jgi:hypothetical protein
VASLPPSPSANRRRFTDVVVFRAEKVGKSEPTRLIGDNRVCSGRDFCTAFAYITCTGPIASNRVFANPGAAPTVVGDAPSPSGFQSRRPLGEGPVLLAGDRRRSSPSPDA